MFSFSFRTHVLPFIVLISAVISMGIVVTPTTTIDSYVWEKFVDLRTPTWTLIARYITWSFDPSRATALAIIAGILVAILTGFKRVGFYVTGSVALSAAVTAIIKKLIQRPRPLEEFRLTVEHSFSFPSGHTTAAATLATSVAMVAYASSRISTTVQRWMVALVAMTLVAVIALTRLYLGVHWLSDVIAGAIVGLASAWLLLPIVRAYAERTQANKKL